MGQTEGFSGEMLVNLVGLDVIEKGINGFPDKIMPNYGQLEALCNMKTAEDCEGFVVGYNHAGAAVAYLLQKIPKSADAISETCNASWRIFKRTRKSVSFISKCSQVSLLL